MLLLLPLVLVLVIFHYIVLWTAYLLRIQSLQDSSWACLRAIDRYGNCLIGGSEHETISSRFGRSPDCKLCAFICRCLNWFEPDHCQKAIGK